MYLHAHYKAEYNEVLSSCSSSSIDIGPGYQDPPVSNCRFCAEVTYPVGIGGRTPEPAIYMGADKSIVEYIRTLGEPTAADAGGKRVTWIESMRLLSLPKILVLPQLNKLKSRS